jgi:hypothetical protein
VYCCKKKRKQSNAKTRYLLPKYNGKKVCGQPKFWHLQEKQKGYNMYSIRKTEIYFNYLEPGLKDRSPEGRPNLPQLIDGNLMRLPSPIENLPKYFIKS